MSQTARAARFTKVIEYRADDVTVSFVPTKDMPGFSHRVNLIDNRTRTLVARDWLAGGVSVSAKAAAFFYDKHVSRLRSA